ncbi:hypothetical protein [Treponema sp. R6D11]
MSKKVVFTVVLVVICLSSLTFGAVSFGLIAVPQGLQKLLKLEDKAKKEIKTVEAKEKEVKKEIEAKEKDIKKKEEQKKKEAAKKEQEKKKEAAKKEEQKKKEAAAKKKEQEKKKELQAKQKAEKEKQIKLGKPTGPLASWLVAESDKEGGIQKALTDKSKQVSGVWATLKLVNGVVNVLQSIQVGGSVIVEASVNPMEELSPIDNVLDKISNMFLLAFSIIIFEKILLAISGYIVFLIIIPVCAIIAIVSIWTSNDKSKIVKVVIVSVIISLIVMFAVPISFYLSTFFEKTVLSYNMNKVLSSIEAKGNTAAKMEKDLTSLKKIGSAMPSYLNNAKNLSNAVVEDMVHYFIIFIFTSIIVPLLAVIGLFFLARYCSKMILNKH